MKSSQLTSRKPTYEPLTEKWFQNAGVTPSNKEHLLKSMSSLEQGRAPTPSFKLYGKTDESVVTDFFNSIEGKVEVPQWMISYDQSRLSKFGPQGGYKDWSILGPLLDLYQIHLADCNGKMLSDTYKGLNLSMLSAQNACDRLKSSKKIEERAAGCPDFELKKTDPVAQQHAVTAVNSRRVDNFFGYVFSRYQKQKPRIFMPMPFATMIDQARWFLPLIERIQEDLRLKGAKSKFTFWADKIGFEPAFKIATDLVKEANLPATGVLIHVQRDFEKMDTTTGTSQYTQVFIPALAQAYNYKEGSEPYNNLMRSMLYTTQMPIASPSGMMVGDHGTASGAEVTNGGETVCNESYSIFAEDIIALECGKENIVYKLLVNFGNGDDGYALYWLENPEQMGRFKEIRSNAYTLALKEYGFRGNPEKEFVSDEYGLFCQNMVWVDNDKNVRHAYPATLILNSIINPEKQYSPKDWDKDYRDLDIIGKLDNGAGLPYFHQLVDYVDNGMKFRLLGTSEKETSRILSKYERYRALQSKDDMFNRQDYDITKSPTIKYIMSKR